jgi:DNA-binding HxlR family transcriptional regulator
MKLEGRLANPARSYTEGFCPMERAMRVVGTRSAILLMREASYGTTRFDDFARTTGLTEAVAASRLKELVEAGLLTKEPYQEPGQRTRQAYVLTEAGRDLVPVLMSLAAWGNKHAPHKPAPSFTHAGCGERVQVVVECAAGHAVSGEELVVSA